MEKQRSRGARTRRTRRTFLGRAVSGTLGLSLLAGCSGSKDGGTTTSSTTTGATDAGGTNATTSAKSSNGGESSTKTVTDAAGRTVDVPTGVERVVGLGPGALRFITYLGATHHVVGVEQLETKNKKRPFRPYDLANPDLQQLPSVGSRKSPDPELLLRQNPDLVIWAYASAGKADGLQKKLDTPVVAIDPGDLNDALRPNFYDSLRLVGNVSEPGEAREIARLVHEDRRFPTCNPERRTSPTRRKPTSATSDGENTVLLYTQPEYPPFSFVGTNNVAGDVTKGLKKKKGAPRVTIDAEQLIKWNPEYLFVDLGTESYSDLSGSKYGSIDAIENGNVFGVFPTRDYSINFGTALADAYAIGSVCYPDAFGDVDPKTKANDIYDQFLGSGKDDDSAKVYDEAAERVRRRVREDRIGQ